jgi:hypothetical protein
MSLLVCFQWCLNILMHIYSHFASTSHGNMYDLELDLKGSLKVIADFFLEKVTYM